MTTTTLFAAALWAIGPASLAPDEPSPGFSLEDRGSTVDGWSPDLVKSEDRFTAALMVKI